MLKIRPIDPDDYLVLEGDQRIGRIRLARERIPGIWIWNVHVQIPGSPAGDSDSLDEAKAAFKAAWERFKQQQGPERIAAGLKALNIRD